MKKIVGFFLLLGSIFISSAELRAKELFESNLSVRALGMGNAFVSVVNDSNVLFYNPARLAAVDGFNFKILSPYILLSDPIKLQSVISSNSSDLAETLSGVFDANVSAGLGTQASFTMPRFGFSFFGDGQLSVDLANPALPDLELRAVGDYGGVIGFAFPIVPALIDMGISIKRIIRQGGVVPISATTIAELNLDLITEEIKRAGAGYGMDLGATFSLPGPIDAAASFVWKNVGGLAFKQTGGPGAPPGESDEMILGFAAGVDLPLVGLTGALDIKHLNDSSIQLSKKINIGVEVNLLNMDFRAGFHQGYYTLGFGLGLGLLALDLATYGVELGEFAGQREDRRYALQLTLELGIDPFFSLGGGSSSSGGSKRMKRRPGIKQRR